MTVRLLIWMWILIGYGGLAAQKPDYNPAKDKRALKFVQKGQAAIMGHEYEKAQKYFSKALRLNYHSSAATRGMAKTYELLGKYEQAASFYDEFLLMNPNYAFSIYFEAAHAHYMAGNYQRALDLFLQYQTLLASPGSDYGLENDLEYTKHQKYLVELDERIQMSILARDSFQFSSVRQVYNLGPNINTKGDEYFPYLTNNKQLLFFTARYNAFSDEDLFVSELSSTGWTVGERVSNSFNSNQNEGMSSLVRNGRKLFFTACKRKRVAGPCDIWQADLEGRTIKNSRQLPGDLNSDAWESQASISCDGKTLYFASNREEGFGGTDIWMSRLQENGEWGTPHNMGPLINTPQDEEAPFISNDGKTLYFSSTGHPGLGEEDIFFSRQDEAGRWSAPRNLGKPVNSSYRELGFYLSADGKTGFFASNRQGGYGRMDIYQFELPEELYSDPITFLEITVFDSLTLDPLQVNIYTPDQTMTTDRQGRLFLCMPADTSLSLAILESVYKPFHKDLSIPKWDNTVFFSVPIGLVPTETLLAKRRESRETPRLETSTTTLRHTLYFEFDNSKISPPNRDDLYVFLEKTLADKNVLEVEIIGYADQIGSNAYNLILSEKRAKSVAVFLKEYGIRVDRILLEGAGELLEAIPEREKRKVEIKFIIQ